MSSLGSATRNVAVVLGERAKSGGSQKKTEEFAPIDTPQGRINDSIDAIRNTRAEIERISKPSYGMPAHAREEAIARLHANIRAHEARIASIEHEMKASGTHGKEELHAAKVAKARQRVKDAEEAYNKAFERGMGVRNAGAENIAAHKALERLEAMHATKSSSSAKGKASGKAEGERTLEQHTHDELKAMAREQGVRQGKTKAETIANIRAKQEGAPVTARGGKSAKHEIERLVPVGHVGARELDPYDKGSLNLARSIHTLYGAAQYKQALGRYTTPILRTMATNVQAAHPGTKPASKSKKADLIDYIDAQITTERQG